MRILLDANIIIYSALKNQENLRKWVSKQSPIISSITQLEVLGYHRITQEEIAFAKRYFLCCELIPINQNIIHIAINLRQQKKMSAGDSIVAATALINDLPVVTANTRDFQHIEGLKLLNPVKM